MGGGSINYCACGHCGRRGDHDEFVRIDDYRAKYFCSSKCKTAYKKKEKILKIKRARQRRDADLEAARLFHHVHHDGEIHKVHHCGGDHDVGYEIHHCRCGKHAINKEVVCTLQHSANEFPICIQFTECCELERDRWHIESGVKISKAEAQRLRKETTK